MSKPLSPKVSNERIKVLLRRARERRQWLGYFPNYPKSERAGWLKAAEQCEKAARTLGYTGEF